MAFHKLSQPRKRRKTWLWIGVSSLEFDSLFLALLSFFNYFWMLTFQININDSLNKSIVKNNIRLGMKFFTYSLKDKPINITSDRLEANNKEKTITFIGNVVTKQEDMTIYGDKVVAIYSEESKEIENVITTGNVKITKEDRVATCRKAVFNNIDKTVVLTEDPKVWQGKDFISGDKMTFLIEEDKIIVEGSVKGIITPKKREK